MDRDAFAVKRDDGAILHEHNQVEVDHRADALGDVDRGDIVGEAGNGGLHAAFGGDVERVALTDAQGRPLGWQSRAGNVLGLYLHGLFEDPAAVRALFGIDAPTLERVFDGLADFVEARVAPGVLASLIAAR